MNKYHAPIVHRTSVDVAKLILKDGKSFSSPVKRGDSARVTPGIEQHLFSGWDCIFASVAPPYGIKNYGTVLVKIKDKVNFAWGSIYTGFSWTKEVAQRSIYDPVKDWMKTQFSRQIYTNNHFDEAIALQIIGHIRKGTTIRGHGDDYDQSTIIKNLLKIRNVEKFWRKVVRHRLGFLEAHFTDDVKLSDLEYVQFRTLDMPIVNSWNLPAVWHSNFIRDYNRIE